MSSKPVISDQAPGNQEKPQTRVEQVGGAIAEQVIRRMQVKWGIRLGMSMSTVLRQEIIEAVNDQMEARRE